MGKTKEHPRYNVLSVRVSDDLRKCVDHAIADGRTVQDFLAMAIHDRLIAEREKRIHHGAGI